MDLRIAGIESDLHAVQLRLVEPAAVILSKLVDSSVESKLNPASFSVSSPRINIINFEIKYFLSL